MVRVAGWLIFVSMLIGCSKGNQNACPSLSDVTSSVSANSIEKGQQLTLQATNLSGVSYQWNLPGSNSLNAAYGNIASVDFRYEGWYYLTLTTNCNQFRKDSHYVDVKVPQGSSPCSVPDNTISFSANGANGSFTSVTTGETMPNDYRMIASGGGNDFSLVFHPSYKNNNQPEDGIYTTGTFSGTNILFEPFELDKVFIMNITYSPTQILYRSVPNQKVYITRVNGKMRATLCSLTLTGSGVVYSYSPKVNAMITEL